ncbi:hypothetical protein [Streptomyces sp. N35]|uniref:hypothetical protein n=1 Tax=Streptomyces sp. N35 TaxID=2795730 RepID=UPI0018F3BDC1|nr:hypothetical protein [Streptomyces sp. N35]
MSPVELIAQADERSLSVSGLACLDCCLPLLGAADDALRPLWAAVESGAGDWGAELALVRAELTEARAGTDAGDDEATRLVVRMLETAPEEPAGAPLRTWADACSAAALRVHRLYDIGGRGGPAGQVRADGHVPTDGQTRADGPQDGSGPLVTGELRRQIRVLELLAGPGGGLRQAHALAVEGRRILRAVVSRRARARV